MAEAAGLRLDSLAVAPYGRELLAPTSLAVPRGASLAVRGGAGTGKSTVLAVLAGRLRPTAGAVTFDGATVDVRGTGFVDQQHELPDGLTAAEHLAVPLLARGRGLRGWGDVEALLTDLGLPASAHHNLLEELSGGQQQRVAIARALIGDPPLICADDPFSELDAASAGTVRGVLQRAVAAGAVLVLATPRAEEAAACDAVLDLGA